MEKNTLFVIPLSETFVALIMGMVTTNAPEETELMTKGNPFCCFFFFLFLDGLKMFKILINN